MWYRNEVNRSRSFSSARLLWNACNFPFLFVAILCAQSFVPGVVAQGQTTRLKVLSYNIHHGEGTDGRLDLQRIAAIINASGADLVALQEVDKNVARTGNVDQPQELAKLTNMQVAFGANIPLQGGEYGNAVLARAKITSFENRQLPNIDQGEQRGILLTTVELKDGTLVRFGSTHFDHRPKPDERLASAQYINQWLDSDRSLPTILAGDLNAGTSSPVLEILNTRWRSASALELPTIPASKPTRQIDFVLLGRPWLHALGTEASEGLVASTHLQAVDSRVLQEPLASDHLPILARIDVISQPASTLATLSRIVFGSCIQQDRPVPILNTMKNEKPGLVIFLGDNIYADTSDPDVMLSKYEILRSKPEFQELLAECEVMATWDDHDFGINDGGADFLFKQTSQQIFLDFWHEPAGTSRRQTPGVYDAREFGPDGKRIQVIMLDTRYFRSQLKKGKPGIGGPYVPDEDQSKTMLGAEQWEWLGEQLKRPADLRIIASGIQCIPSSEGQETWSNLPRERTRLIQLLTDSPTAGTVLISGDRHWSELSVLDKESKLPLYELTSSSLNQIHGRGTPTDNAFRALPTTVHQPNYGLIEIDWSRERPSVVLEIRDLKGATQMSQKIRY